MRLLRTPRYLLGKPPLSTRQILTLTTPGVHDDLGEFIASSPRLPLMGATCYYPNPWILKDFNLV